MRIRGLCFALLLLCGSAAGCDQPAAATSTRDKPAATPATEPPPAAPAAPAPAPAPAVDAPKPQEPPPSTPSGKLEIARTYLFRGIGRGEGQASVLQQNLAESFTAGVADCAKQYDVHGRFGIMLLTKPDKGELEVNGVKGPTQVPPKFVECVKPIYKRALMPEGERFDGMLMIDYLAP